ncbi:hypothetical protein SAMD00023353_1401420 [Rosellinia necatrix]|uniref:Uncharacterized protein n=1 Tax=Rosellinia necatrix TaxID=77044 RepID=A0A1W2TD08_ROSNE|nr:hypothetical protein SAMD00023353_1401420 [Rosellinia necatrix]
MPSGQHESFFTYGLTRPLPFRWFTPGAVVAGVISLALFTFLNFASAGYNLIVTISTNPNATISEGSWLQHWPSYLSAKVQPTCEPANLPVNSQFFTNQTALTYTLTGVWQHHDATSPQVVSPSLSYYNNVLNNCSVASIVVDLSSMDRSGNQFAYAEWGALIRSYITCQIVTTAGLVFLNLTQTYDYVPDTIPFTMVDKFLGTGFLARNKTTQASLYWGETLMSTYYGAVTWAMELERTKQTQFLGEPGIRKGTVSFAPNGSFPDIKDLRFFNADYRFIVDKGQAIYDVVCCDDSVPAPKTPGALDEAGLYPNIWTEVDTLAKATYSTVLTDLGQAAAAPNILADDMLLTHFTANFSRIRGVNFKPGPANGSFEELKDTTGPLRITPSVISTTYICQVPQLKSASSLILAIVVSNVVLLQVMWQLYKISTEWYLSKRHPTMNYCEGCLEIISRNPVISSEGISEGHPLFYKPNYVPQNSRESMTAYY